MAEHFIDIDAANDEVLRLYNLVEDYRRKEVSVRSLNAQINNLKTKNFLSEMYIQSILKDKIFLLELVKMLFKTIQLTSTEVTICSRMGALFRAVNTIFTDLYGLINKHLVGDVPLFKNEIKAMERKCANLVSTINYSNEEYIKMSSCEEIMEQLLPLAAISIKSRKEKITVHDIQTFNNKLTEWINLPVATRFSVVRSIAILKLSSSVLESMCKMTGYQPFFETSQFTSDYMFDSSIADLKTSFIDCFTNIFSKFIDKTKDVNDLVLYSNIKLPIVTEDDCRQELVLVQQTLAMLIADNRIGATITIDPEDYVTNTTLPGVDILTKKIELCNEFILDLNLCSKILPNDKTTNTNLLSLLMFKFDIYENLLSIKSQKKLMMLVIELLIGMLTHGDGSNNDLYIKIYQIFEFASKTNDLHQLQVNLETTILKYEHLVKVMTDFCLSKGLNIEELLFNKNNNNNNTKLDGSQFNQMFSNYIKNLNY